MYIREAHPDSVLVVKKDGAEVLEKIAQSDSLEKRKENAEVCLLSLNLSIPAVLDKADNAVNTAYAGWPDRLVVVGADGKVAYIGGPGPGGFKPEEVAAWLKEHVKK